MAHIFKSFALLILIQFTANAPALADISFADKLTKAALERTKHKVTYSPKYYALKYPGGDVPSHVGVCTDVVIRSYRALGIDLQKDIHEDMKGHFSLYPKVWGARSTDKNIDHRRVPNMRVFFTRHGQKLPVTKNAKDYKAGDLVTWNLSKTGFLPHIGIVSNKKSLLGVPLIIHNDGQGPELENMLFDYKITGHYRYEGRK